MSEVREAVRVTREDYTRIFEEECARSYPAVDAFEEAMGYAIDRDRLEDLARTLACPFKVNPPNWQHGRVIYAMVRRLCDAGIRGNFLDIGTAKGFSAVIAAWAADDADADGSTVYSVDVLHPEARVRRNSVLELDGYKTIEEYTSRYIPDSITVRFYGGGSQAVLRHLLSAEENLAFAFVDGKHLAEDVRREAHVISQLQNRGAVTVFDDCQIPQVAASVRQASGYAVRYLDAGSNRRYAIATRK